MNNRQLLLSVVIPTKNRYEYLEKCLNLMLACESDQFEVIVQDNSDDSGELEKYSLRLHDSRVLYNHVSGWVSVVDNCDRGISLATGRYVCMLGDDDGILLENALPVLRELDEYDVDAIVTNRINYSWPDSPHAIWSGIQGRFFLPNYSWTTTPLSVEMELRHVLSKGAAVGVGRLPCVYHGFVKKKVLDRLKRDAGTHFPGPSPDMSNAVALTKYATSCLFADVPLIISGHGGKSTGGQGARRQHHGKIESQLHLPQGTADRWTKEIPFFWSGPTIYSESATKALERTERSDDWPLNYDMLYARCLVYESSNWKATLLAVNSSGTRGSRVKTYTRISYFCAVLLILRAQNFLKNIAKHKLLRRQWFEAADIVEAERAVVAHCEKRIKLFQASLSNRDIL